MSIDWAVLHWIRDTFSCAFLDFWMPKITALGNAGIIWIAAALWLACTKRWRKQGFIFLAGLAVGFLVCNAALKPLVARPRPCWLDNSVSLLIASPTDFSFPSGHTLFAALSAAILTLTNRKFGVAAILLTVLIAFSRLYLYVHFPSDVFCGAGIGVALGVIVYYVGAGIARRRATESQ